MPVRLPTTRSSEGWADSPTLWLDSYMSSPSWQIYYQNRFLNECFNSRRKRINLCWSVATGILYFTIKSPEMKCFSALWPPVSHFQRKRHCLWIKERQIPLTHQCGHASPSLLCNRTPAALCAVRRTRITSTERPSARTIITPLSFSSIQTFTFRSVAAGPTPCLNYSLDSIKRF